MGADGPVQCVLASQAAACYSGERAALTSLKGCWEEALVSTVARERSSFGYAVLMLHRVDVANLKRRLTCTVDQQSSSRLRRAEVEGEEGEPNKGTQQDGFGSRPLPPKQPASANAGGRSTLPGQPKKSSVPHSRLSFGEELDEEDAEPSTSYSISQTTARRFESERDQRLPFASSILSPFAHTSADQPGSEPARKALGPLSYGVAQTRGPRPYMEDRYTVVSSYTPLSFTSQPLADDVLRTFAAVYDGHNGSKAAEHACSRLHMVLAQEPALRSCTGEAAGAALPWGGRAGGNREATEAAEIGRAVRRAFGIVDGEILERARAESGRDGATALVVLRIGDTLWAAHAGDSRAVLSRGGSAVRLTQDHKPDLIAEKARVEAAGGRVDFQRCWRVICPAREGRPASGLAVSRSLGDLDFKEPARYIECEPDVTRLRILPEDKFVILASDGLWDVLEDQEAVSFIQEKLGPIDGSARRAVLDASAKEASEALMRAAVDKGSLDNITVLLLLLHWH